MDEFEYVMVLTSLVLGLGITQLLLGISSLLRNREKVKSYLPHILCVVVVFGLHIQEWWITYTYSTAVTYWMFSQFVVIIIFPIILFIMARLLFPVTVVEKNNFDLKQFYLVNYRKFYFFGFLLVALSIPQNITLLDMGVSDQYPQLFLSLLMLIPVYVKTQKDTFHYSLTAAITIMGVFYVLIKNPTL